MIQPTVTELILIRHGETEWNAEGRLMNQKDSPLSSLGREQAVRLAERMASSPADLLYSSDLGRAVATAQAIADRCATKVHLEPGLRELGLGIFEGYTWAEIEALYPAELARYRTDSTYTVPGGESSTQFHDRTIKCLEGILSRHEGQRIAAVAHGGTLRVLFRYVAGLPPADLSPARQLNASLNIFEVAGGIWRLRTWGDVAHLPAYDAKSVSAQHDAIPGSP